MTKLGDITKSGILLTVQQEATVHEAVRLMDSHDAGIVTVLDGQRLAGVLSERDVVRRVVGRGLDPARTRVADVMTRRVIVAEVDEDCRGAIRRREAARVGYLLVGAEGHLLSMISIGDLMRAAAHEQEQEMLELREHVARVPSGRTPYTAI